MILSLQIYIYISLVYTTGKKFYLEYFWICIVVGHLSITLFLLRFTVRNLARTLSKSYSFGKKTRSSETEHDCLPRVRQGDVLYSLNSNFSCFCPQNWKHSLTVKFSTAIIAIWPPNCYGRHRTCYNFSLMNKCHGTLNGLGCILRVHKNNFPHLRNNSKFIVTRHLL